MSIEDITLKALEEMSQLAPYGMGNPKPKVLIKEVDIANMRKIGAQQNHLKITLDHDGSSLDGVGFGLGGLCDQVSPASKLSVIGELSINEWNNKKKPQIFVEDLSVPSWQLFDCRGSKNLHNCRKRFANRFNKMDCFSR